MAGAVFPGSFDPPTRGHLDLVERASHMFDPLTIAIIDNPNKRGLFPLEERKRLWQRILGPASPIIVDSFSGLLVDYLHHRQAQVVVRGLRHAHDLEGEFQMARLNQEMSPAMDTVFLAARPQHVHISSSFVREIARLGGDFSFMVPSSIMEDIQRKISGKADPA